MRSSVVRCFVSCMDSVVILSVSLSNVFTSNRIGMLITRKIEFSSSHFCRNRKWSDAENEAVYGAAANPHGHGHNYVAEVTLQGEPDPVTGMVMDLKVI